MLLKQKLNMSKLDIIQIHSLVGLKFYIGHIYIFQLQIFQQNVYFSQLLHSYFIVLCLFGAHVRGGAFSELN